MEELMRIQSELKAPKGQFNSFGKYKYRSAEDILEAVKPLLAANGCILTLTDEIVLIGDRYYIKAVASITNKDRMSVDVSAFAREEETKKGMDASQITGTASSYARKYALNGLFCIDDTRDADATNTHGEESGPAKKATIAVAVAQARIAKSERALVAVWNMHKGDFGENEEFKKAIGENPNNPKNKENGTKE